MENRCFRALYFATLKYLKFTSLNVSFNTYLKKKILTRKIYISLLGTILLIIINNCTFYINFPIRINTKKKIYIYKYAITFDGSVSFNR